MSSQVTTRVNMRTAGAGGRVTRSQSLRMKKQGKRTVLGDVSNSRSNQVAGNTKKRGASNANAIEKPTKRRTQVTARLRNRNTTNASRPTSRATRRNTVTTKTSAAGAATTRRSLRQQSKAKQTKQTRQTKTARATGVTTRMTRKRSKQAADENENPNLAVQDSKPLRKKSKTMATEEPEEKARTMDSKTVEETPTHQKLTVPNTEEKANVAELVHMLSSSSIDCDADGDAYSLAEFAHEIYTSNRLVEPQYMPNVDFTQQDEVNPRMRQKLTDWLIDLHKRFKLESETLFLSVNILDRFLARKTVYKSTFQLVGCCALLLASKYEEIYPPVAQDFVYMSANAFTREELLSMETTMLNALSFNVTVPSMQCFAMRFMKVCGVGAEDSKSASDILLRNQVQYFLELTLEQYCFSKYNYSLIAATSLYLALRLMSDNADDIAQKLEVLHSYSGYSLNDMNGILRHYHSLLNSQPRYKAVRNKFADIKYQSVSELNSDNAFEGLGFEVSE